MMPNKKKDEYDDIYRFDEEDSRNYEELDEDEDPDDIIARLKGTIGRGDCPFCGGKLTMKYEGNVCFICEKCHEAIDERPYYLWVAGYPIDFGDDE